MLSFIHTPETILTSLKALVEMAVLWLVFYRILLFFEGTRAFQVLRGITYLIIALFLSQILGFDVLNWLLRNFFSLWIIGIVVLFQHELRAGLARLGQQHLFSIYLGESEIEALVEKISEAVFRLAKRKIGCLIAMEREMKLDLYIESGIRLDSMVSCELLQSIFMPNGPLHDGGVIIRGEHIAASSCLFPLSENPGISKTVATRHRAALGLSEQTDAVIVLASEETGEVSMALDGHLTSVHEEELLVKQLKSIMSPKGKHKR